MQQTRAITKKSTFLVLLFGFFTFLFFYLNLDDVFLPWTRWETMRTIKYGGDDEAIILSISYLGSHADRPEVTEYVKYVIQYIDDCEGGVYGSLRGRLYQFTTQLADDANDALEGIVGLDFGYEWTKDCKGPENQAAIQAWKDWYANDYEEWVEERYEELKQ